MTTRRIASAVAALAAGAVVLTGAAPALAQQGNGNGNGQPSQCPNPGGVYAPGQCGETPPTEPPGQNRVDDGTPGRGQEMRAETRKGAFDPGTPVEYGAQSTYIRLGLTTAAPDGSAAANLVIPTQLTNGAHSIVFSGVLNGQPATERLAITVTGGAPLTDAAGNVISSDGGGSTTGSGRGVVGALPTTGRDEIVPLAASGAALLLVGTGIVVVARRKRNELDTTAAV